jgi:hypothetical protein
LWSPREVLQGRDQNPGLGIASLQADVGVDLLIGEGRRLFKFENFCAQRGPVGRAQHLCDEFTGMRRRQIWEAGPQAHRCDPHISK